MQRALKIRIIKRSTVVLALVCVLSFWYYSHRTFIQDRAGKEFLTLWCTPGMCYVIPGKYYSILPPDRNYIATKLYRNNFSVVWNTGDESKFKVAFSNSYKTVALDPMISVFSSTDELMKEYGILDSVQAITGERYYSPEAAERKRACNYQHYSTDHVFGYPCIDCE